MTMIYYLGGPIRTNSPDLFAQDVEWRHQIKDVARIRELNVKFTDPAVNDYTLVDPTAQAGAIYRNDIQLMNLSTGGIFNLLALKTGYPCHGAIFEIGYLTGKGKPCYGIAEPKCPIRIHPMLQGVCWLPSLEAAFEILM